MPADVPTDAAIDAPPNLDLTVMLSGTGSGRVTSSVGGIDCGTTCAHDYPPNTTVTLTAEPAVGSVFAGWMGGCTGTSPTCDVTLAHATTVTATFTLKTFTVTVGKVGVGTGTVMGSGINCGATCTTTVSYGTAITLTAAPLALSNFIGWSAPCTGTGTCTTTITANTTITAAFALNDISMTVTKSGNGSGTVTSAPAGINCGVDCDQIYVANTMVTLTAAPAIGSTFTGWSGAGCTGTGACIVTMTTAVLVTATFTLDRFQLDVARGGNGTGTVTSAPAGIACGGDCNEIYDYNTMVTLTAAAGTGSTFTGWNGGGCTGTGTCVVAVTAATSVTATFTLDMHLLTVALAGTGSGAVTSTPAGITCGVDCNQLYNHGTMVSLAAAPSVGSTFSGWSGACTGTGACVVPMTAAASVTATFTIKSYALTVALAGNGAGSVASSPAGISCGADCTEVYTHGTVVTLTPTAMVGSTFAGWSGACTGTGACAVTMTAVSAVTASFTLNTYALTVVAAGTGTGTISSTPAGINCGIDCSEIYNHGTIVTLSQSAGTGSTFAGWSGACTGTGACMVTMDMARSVTATFTLNTYTLTVSPLGAGSGTVTSSPAGISCGADCTEVYGHGTVVTLSQTAATGSVFASWGGGVCSGTGSCTVTMDMARTVTATFNIATYTLTVTNASSAGGVGTISSTTAGISCGADCTEVYNYGTIVTLTASPGTASNFIGWSACAGLGACTITITADTSVTGTFSAPNVMFVTAGTYRGAFAVNAAAGANAYADSQCQMLATAAGLVGNAPGQDPEFRAWLSSGNSAGIIVNAVSRFTGSSGWIRAGDWLPVMNTPTDLASSKIWYPPRRTQDGVDLGADAQLWTGTDSNGMYTGVACVNGNAWTTGKSQILATIGLSSATGSPITQFLDLTCGSSRRLLCMGVGRNTSVGAPPAGGKLAFTSVGTWTPNANGINGADSVCTAEATTANLPGTYKALLTPFGSSAIRRFTSTGRPWVRVGDRQPITALEADMFSPNTTVLDVAPNASASGNRIGIVSIYTGAPTVNSIGDAQGTCGDWRNPGEFKGTAGFPFDTGMQNYFFGAQNNNAPCSVARHLVCLQE